MAFNNSKVDTATAIRMALLTKEQLGEKPVHGLTGGGAVTPFAGEDIGWILNSGAEDLLMFASDYPHHEGTDDPIGRFERTMEKVDENQRSKFYTKNFKSLLGSHL